MQVTILIFVHRQSLILSVTMVSVYLAVADVMVTMTVEITVMKKDAVCGPVCTCTCSWVHFLIL